MLSLTSHISLYIFIFFQSVFSWKKFNLIIFVFEITKLQYTKEEIVSTSARSTYYTLLYSTVEHFLYQSVVENLR